MIVRFLCFLCLVPMVSMDMLRRQDILKQVTQIPVKVGVVNIETKKTIWSDFNERDDQYFGTPFWTPDGSALWVQWMNRAQNHLIVYAVDPASGNKKPVYD